jgi:predicted phosphohydrolase
MEDLQAHLRSRGLQRAAASPHDPDQVKVKVPWGQQSQGRRIWRNLKQVLRELGPLSFLVDDALPVIALCASGLTAARGAYMAGSCLGMFAALLAWRVVPPRRPALGLRIVCISDTHGKHRQLRLPAGDVLIHAGDFTKFGRREDADDFNKWLADLPFVTKVVVNGNHENNAEWQKEVRGILTNATFLKEEGTSVLGLRIYGTDFCWPMRQPSPSYAKIPCLTDIVIAHGPVKGFVDGQRGCTALLWEMARVRPRLVISGHIHEAHGICCGRGTLRGTTFVNAANCKDGYGIGWGPIVIDL